MPSEPTARLACCLDRKKVDVRTHVLSAAEIEAVALNDAVIRSQQSAAR